MKPIYSDMIYINIKNKVFFCNIIIFFISEDLHLQYIYLLNRNLITVSMDAFIVIKGYTVPRP